MMVNLRLMLAAVDPPAPDLAPQVDHGSSSRQRQHAVAHAPTEVLAQTLTVGAEGVTAVPREVARQREFVRIPAGKSQRQQFERTFSLSRHPQPLQPVVSAPPAAVAIQGTGCRTCPLTDPEATPRQIGRSDRNFGSPHTSGNPTTERARSIGILTTSQRVRCGTVGTHPARARRRGRARGSPQAQHRVGASRSVASITKSARCQGWHAVKYSCCPST